MRLAGKTAIITGGASGIGEASAKLFAREGARVAVVDIDTPRGEKVVSEIGDAAIFVAADIAKADEARLMVQTVAQNFKKIDILFNNAGISCVGALHETAEEEWDRVMAVNLKSIYFVCRNVVPLMIEQSGGCIINMASGVSVLGLAKRAAYTASKGAVYALTKSMQADYCQYKIRVNSILPGTIYTPFVEGYLARHYADDIDKAIENLKRRQLSGTLGSPEDVAYAALYLASDEAKFVYGSGLVVDGGFLAAKIFD
ncbi:MAG: glucose 1-dehydrogenase [Acidobacteriaceae bacterium]|nr:glucose 1-dehydrogenase [Acidobacteriaceae bacterium]